MSINIDLKEWQVATTQTHPQLAEISLPDDESSEGILQGKDKPLTIRRLRKGIELETSSYVGRISLGNMQVTIRPKIQMMCLARLMCYAYSLPDAHNLFLPAEFDVEVFAFQDLLIYQLASEANRLLSRGLQRQYVRKEENLLSPRGRIVISQIANRGGLIQESLPCDYHLRLDDCPLNQVLLQGVRLGAQLTNNEKLCLRLQHLERSQLSGISSRRLTWTMLQRAQREINRLTASYAPAIKLIELLFLGAGLSLDGEQSVATLPGFLFDMNRFFQDLLSRFLCEHLPEYEFQDQYVLDSMMSYTENPRRRQSPSLRPDYVIKSQGKIVAILDAKYRDLWERDLPTHMLYQLVMYAIGQATCDSVTILYPTTDPGATKARIEVSVPLSPKGAVSVVLCPVNLLHLDTLLTEAKARNNMRERRDLARYLLGKG